MIMRNLSDLVVGDVVAITSLRHAFDPWKNEIDRSLLANLAANRGPRFRLCSIDGDTGVFQPADGGQAAVYVHLDGCATVQLVEAARRAETYGAPRLG